MKDAMNVSEIATAKTLAKAGVSVKAISDKLCVTEKCINKFIPKKKRKSKAKK